MSTKASLYYSERWGHVFREMGDGEYYWSKSYRWHRLPFRFIWIWLERRQMRRLNEQWEAIRSK